MQQFTFHRDQLADALKNLDEFTAETRRELDSTTVHPVGFWEARMATRVELNAHVIAASRSLLAVLSIAMKSEASGKEMCTCGKPRSEHVSGNARWEDYREAMELRGRGKVCGGFTAAGTS